MGIYEELVDRGLIAQVTNEEAIREMINNESLGDHFLNGQEMIDSRKNNVGGAERPYLRDPSAPLVLW